MKILKDLLLACVNATLVLVALCLFLLWQLSGTVERVTAEFSSNLSVLAPVKTRIDTLTQEVVALRNEVSQRSPDADLQLKLSKIESEAQRLNDVLTNISKTPERVMQTSIRATAESATDVLLQLRSCKAEDAAS